MTLETFGSVWCFSKIEAILNTVSLFMSEVMFLKEHKNLNIWNILNLLIFFNDLLAGHQCSGQSLGGQSISVHSEGAAFVPRSRGWRHRGRAAQLCLYEWETTPFYLQSSKISRIEPVESLSNINRKTKDWDFFSPSESRDEGTTWLLVSSRLAPDDGMYHNRAYWPLHRN